MARKGDRNMRCAQPGLAALAPILGDAAPATGEHRVPLQILTVPRPQSSSNLLALVLALTPSVSHSLDGLARTT